MGRTNNQHRPTLASAPGVCPGTRNDQNMGSNHDPIQEGTPQREPEPHR